MGNEKEFHHVDAPFSPFVLGDETLRTSQAICQFLLSDPGFFAGRYQQGNEPLMLGRA